VEGRPALHVVEGGLERSPLPPVIRLRGEILRLGAPIGTTPLGSWLAGEWGPAAQRVSVRLIPRPQAPNLPGLLRRMLECRHGAVPRVLCLERWEDCWCVLSEPLEGTSLALRLATGRPPSQRWCFRLGWQLTYAVLSAHACGLASGSIHESGIWLTSDNYLKLPEWSSELADPAVDWRDLVEICRRLNLDLPTTPTEWLPWFEQRARRFSVYEPI